MKLSIVIPCYNEGKNVSMILDNFQHIITRDDIEIVLVNNGSTDETADILEKALPLYSFLSVVHVKKNQGYGFGILSGLEKAKGEYIGWTHGDMQTPPEDVLRALAIIEKAGNSKEIYVKGLRKGRSLFDVFFTFGMSVFETIFLREKLYDINAQPNIFHRSFFEDWKNPPHDFSLDLYVFYLARKKKMNVVRFDCVFANRVHGESHWNKNFYAKWKFIKRTLAFSLELRKRLKNI